MKKLLLKECYFLRKSAIAYAIMLAVSIACHTFPVIKDTHFLYFINSVIFLTLCYCSFISDQKCLLSSAIAPVKRSDLVNTKYIFLALILLFGVVFSIGTSFLGSCFLGNSMSELLKYELLLLGLIALSCAISYPFVFVFGANAIALLPIEVGFTMGFISGMSETEVFSDDWLPEIGIVAIVCVIALVISYLISLLIYKRRNIK